MHHWLEGSLLLLTFGAIVAAAAKRLSLPYNVALVVMGLVFAMLDVLPPTRLSPDVVLLVFLPILVFEGALFADAGALRSATRPIAMLALPGVAVSLLGTALVASLALGLPFVVAVLLGALLAITDTVSVLLAFRSVRVPHRLTAIMEGESLFNDGTALVLVGLAATAAQAGAVEASGTIRALFAAIVGGVVVGLVFGVVGTEVLRRVPDHLTSILASVILAFGASVVAERVHASPVIAVVVVGLAVGRAARRHLEPSRVLSIQGFWETAGFVVNVVLFLVAGMQISGRSLVEEAGSIGLALVALHVGRAVAVYGGFGLLAWRGDRTPIRWQHVMLFGNIKGALSMAAVLALPESLPHRARLVTIVFGVTFVSLVTQALPFRKFLVFLGVTEAETDRDDEARATLIAARRGQSVLDSLLGAGLLSRMDHARRKAELQRQIVAAEGELRRMARTDGERVVELAVLGGQKAALVDALQRGLVAEAVVSRRIGELDRALLDVEKGEPR